MKTRNYLLPYTYKKIGMWMFLPFAAICLCLFFNVELPKISIPWIAIGEHFFYDGTADLLTEVGMMGLLVSLSFIALSREKDEDYRCEPQAPDKRLHPDMSRHFVIERLNSGFIVVRYVFHILLEVTNYFFHGNGLRHIVVVIVSVFLLRR